MISVRLDSAALAAPGPPVIRGVYNGQAVFSSMGYEQNGTWKWDFNGTGKAEMRFKHHPGIDSVRLEVYFPYDHKNLGPIYYTGEVVISNLYTYIRKLSARGTLLDTEYMRDDLIELKASCRQSAQELGASHGNIKLRVALELPQHGKLDADDFHIVDAPNGIGDISEAQLRRERAMGYSRGKGMAGKVPNTINNFTSYRAPVTGEVTYRPPVRRGGQSAGMDDGYTPVNIPPAYAGKVGRGRNYMPEAPKVEEPYRRAHSDIGVSTSFRRAATYSEAGPSYRPTYSGASVATTAATGYSSSSLVGGEATKKYGYDTSTSYDKYAYPEFTPKPAANSSAWEQSRSLKTTPTFDRSGTGLGAAATTASKPRRLSLSGGYSTLGQTSMAGGGRGTDDMTMPDMPCAIMEGDTVPNNF